MVEQERLALDPVIRGTTTTIRRAEGVQSDTLDERLAKGNRGTKHWQKAPGDNMTPV